MRSKPRTDLLYEATAWQEETRLNKEGDDGDGG